MKIIELLNEAHTLLANTHPLGLDAARHGKAMENIRTVADALEEIHRKQVARREELARREAEREKQRAETKEGEAHGDEDEQG